MSNQEPPAGPPPPPPSSAQPPSAPPPPPPDAGAPETPGSEEPGRPRRGVFVGVLVAALLLLVPGGVFAWRALDGSGPQPHDVLPADAFGYVRVDLDPSAGQKVEAFRFLRKFPALEEAVGTLSDDMDLRERILDEFTAASGCDIDFEADVEPWLGERLGFAMLPPADDGAEPGLVFALQVDDTDTAEQAVRDGLGCDLPASEFGRAYLDGYMIVAEHAEDAERYADAARESALAENEEFVEAMDLIGEQGIASAWFSGGRIIETFGQPFSELGATDEYGTGAAVPPLDEMQDMFEDAYRSVAVALRFDDSYGEIATVATGDLYTELDGAGVQADVPEDTAAMLGMTSGGEYLRESWDTLLESDPNMSSMLDDLAMQTGLAFPDDLATLFGDNFVVAVDGAGLTPELFANGDMSTLGIGAKVSTDPEAAREVWEKIEALAAQSGAPMTDLPFEITDDGYLIASTPEYQTTLAEGGSLGSSDRYQAAVKDADDADVVFYVNADVIEEAVLSTTPDIESAVADTLRALSAVGYSAHVHDGHVEFTMRVTAD